MGDHRRQLNEQTHGPETASASACRRRFSAPAGAVLQGVLLVLLTVAVGLGCAACSDSSEGSLGASTTTLVPGGPEREDIEGSVGEDVEVGDAVVTVRALQAAFQPAMPTQRLSDETPTAPASGETFYQAYVRVANNGDKPIRVDAAHFTCLVGSTVVKIEATRSGPAARSLIGGTSLDFLLTFKAVAGYEPVLLYSPPWHNGTIRIRSAVEETTTTD